MSTVEPVTISVLSGKTAPEHDNDAKGIAEQFQSGSFTRHPNLPLFVLISDIISVSIAVFLAAASSMLGRKLTAYISESFSAQKILLNFFQRDIFGLRY